MNYKSKDGATIIQISLSIGILLIAGAIAYYFLYTLPRQNGPGSISQNNVVLPSQNTQVQQPKPQAPKPGEIIIVPISMGQTFNVGNIGYTVQSAKDKGNQLSPYSQKSSGKYVEVKFSAKNIGTNTASVNTIYHLQDSLKRQYETVNTFDFSTPDGYKQYTSSDGQINSFGFDLGLNDLKPGFSQNYDSIFEVAADSQGLWVIMGDGKNQNYYVPLGI